MIRALLSRGADPLQELGNQETPLFRAAVKKTIVLDTVFLLIFSGHIVERIVTKVCIRMG